MKIYPEQTRKQLDYVIDWLNRWACVREFGLGTKLPWDENWVIESLSDSTIQMAYNTISKYLQHPEEHGFKTDKLNVKYFIQSLKPVRCNFYYSLPKQGRT